MISQKDILAVVESYPADQRYALAILQDLQRKFGYIPREGLSGIAGHLHCPVAQLYSMATFYKALSLKAKGRHIIKLCDGTACHIKGSPNLVDGVERALGIKPGETTEDGLFSLELVNCLGSCAIAPVMVIDEQYYGKMTLERLPGILAAYREEGER